MSTKWSAYSFRLSQTVLNEALQVVDDLVGMNATLNLVIRAITAGELPLPEPPADYGPLDAKPTVRLIEDVWTDSRTGAVDDRFETIRSRNALARDLIYALAEGRVSVEHRCTVKEVHGDRSSGA